MLDDIPDDNLRKKLQNYSENPDDNVWDKIQSGVSGAATPMKDRLIQYQEQPDEAVWQSVTDGLRIERSLQRLDFGGRVAAAIAILCLLYPLLFTGLERKDFDKTAIDTGNRNRTVTDSLTQRAKAPENEKLQATVDTSLIQNPVNPKPSAAKSNSEILKSNSSADLSDNPRADNNFNSAPEIEKKSLLSLEAEDLKTSIPKTSPENPDDTTQYFSTGIKGIELSQNQYINNSLSASGVDSTVLIDREILIPQKDSAEHKADVKQNAEKEKSKERKPKALYALLMPTLGYQQVSPVKNDNILIEGIERVSAFSPKRLGIRAEVGIEKLINKRISFNVGLLYYQRKQTINYLYRDTENATVNVVSLDSMLYDVDNPQETGTFEYEVRNIGAVFGLAYTIQGKHFTQRIGIAAEFHRGLNAARQEVNTGQQYFLFGDVYYRIAYPVSKRFDLTFQPTINYALQVDNRINAPFYIKPYGLGLNFGACFHF